MRGFYRISFDNVYFICVRTVEVKVILLHCTNRVNITALYPTVRTGEVCSRTGQDRGRKVRQHPDPEVRECAGGGAGGGAQTGVLEEAQVGSKSEMTSKDCFVRPLLLL